MPLRFLAPDYHADGRFVPAEYRLDGSPEVGWRIERNGRLHLVLGPGYRLMRSAACGVCSTDLARQFLPFPLPQVTGHELLALDDEGARHVVEINASCEARRLDAPCLFCQAGLAHHCPERIVVGIHDLPGGFGPWVLVPVGAALPVPDELPSETAVLVEPFAAALHAVTCVAPRSGDVVAVLGPRRLGMLVIAALAGYRQQSMIDFRIVALARRATLVELARRLGADESIRIDGDGASLPDGLADVVIDTTGAPSGLELAIRIAKREVHLKSTHGRSAVGVAHLTELVVDEISIERLPARPPTDRTLQRVAWLAAGSPPTWLSASADVLTGRSVDAMLVQVERAGHGELPRVDAAVIDSKASLDPVIRPSAEHQRSLVRPCGVIWLDAKTRHGGSPLIEAIVQRDLRLTTSRCGDFRVALDLIRRDPQLRQLGRRLVTHTLDSGDMNQVFETARSTDCIKAVVRHAPDAEPS